MKGWKIFWGLVFIATAVLLILEAVGVLSPVVSVFGNITFWQIVGGVLLLAAAVSALISGEIGGAVILLGFVFMVFERNIAFVCNLGSADIINNWLLFWCTVLLSIGFAFLKPKGWKKSKRAKNKDGRNFNAKINEMGASEIYIDCERFGTEYTEQFISNHLGAFEVTFENVESYKGGGTIRIENNLGATNICIPKSWRVIHDVNCSLGAFEQGENDKTLGDDAPIIHIVGSTHLGAIEIERV